MTSDVDGQLKSGPEAVKKQVNAILGVKASTLSQEMKSLLVDGHPEFSLG